MKYRCSRPVLRRFPPATDFGCILVAATAAACSGPLTDSHTPAEHPASPSKSIITVSSPSATAGDTITITLIAKDSNGQVIGVGGASVSFRKISGTSDGILGPVSDAGTGKYVAIFIARRTGSPCVIGGTINGALVSTDQPSIAVAPGSVSTSASTVGLSSSTLVAGDSGLLTLTAKDAFDNQLDKGGLHVAFNQRGGSSGGTIGETNDHGNGTYTAVFTALAAGTPTTIRAMVGGDTLTSALPTLSVLPGLASVTASVVAASTDTMRSGNSITLTLQAKDGLGNHLAAGGLVVAFNAFGGSSTGAIGPTNDFGNGSYSASFTGLISGTATTVGATIGGTAVTTARPAITVVAGSASATTSLLDVSAMSVIAGQSVTLSLRTRDAAGNRIVGGGATVTFTQTNGTSSGLIGAATDSANGIYTAVFTGLRAGTPITLGATINGASIATAAPRLTVSPGSADPSSSIMSTSKDSVDSGTSVTLTLLAEDTLGNQLKAGGATVSFSMAGGTSTGVISPTLDLGNGSYTATLTGVGAGAVATISAVIDGQRVTTRAPTIVVNPGRISASTSVITVASLSVPAGQVTALTLVGHDAAGNLLVRGGDTVAFGQGGGSSTGTISPTADLENGTYAAFFTGEIAGTPTSIEARIGSVAVSTPSPALTVVVGPVSLQKSAFSISSPVTRAGDSTILLLRARDAGGNALSTGGLSVAFALGSGTSDGVIGATVDSGNGAYSAAFRGLLSGMAREVVAYINGQPVISSRPRVTVVPAVAVSLTSSPVLTILAPGTSAPLTIVATDIFGNSISASAATFTSLNSAAAQVTGLTVRALSDGIAELVASVDSLRDTVTVVVAGNGTLVGILGAPNREAAVQPLATLSFDFALDATRAFPKSLGSFTLRLSTDPQVIRLDSITAADVQNVAVNMAAASSGTATVGGFSAVGVPTNAVLFRAWVTAVGQSGERARLKVSALDLTETTSLADLKRFALITDARVRIQ